MAETMVIVLVSVNTFLALSLLVFAVWREVEHRKQIDALTSKIMSESYREYATYKKVEETQEQEKPKKKVFNDPTLGSHY